MLKIGLTGNIGAGKSTVARLFHHLGVPVYIADIRARILTDSPDLTTIIEKKLGPGLLTNDGILDRKKLASLVFGSRERLEQLNQLIHPEVVSDFEAWCQQHVNQPFVIHEAAILFESGLAPLFHQIIMVAAPAGIRISRVMQRDRLTREEVEQRMEMQWPEERKTALAQHIIVNDGNLMLIPQVLNIWKKLNEQYRAESEMP